MMAAANRAGPLSDLEIFDNDILAAADVTGL